MCSDLCLFLHWILCFLIVEFNIIVLCIVWIYPLSDVFVNVSPCLWLVFYSLNGVFHRAENFNFNEVQHVKFSFIMLLVLYRKFHY